jgi:uncharacterized membrane protein
MSETQPENNSRSTMQVVLGFLLGVLIALGCLFFSIFLGTALALQQQWLFPVFTGVGLIVAGIVAFRQMKESSYAFGIVIALSIAVLLDAACGVAFYR